VRAIIADLRRSSRLRNRKFESRVGVEGKRDSFLRACMYSRVDLYLRGLKISLLSLPCFLDLGAARNSVIDFKSYFLMAG
jgi:hypothetical protein